MQFETQVGNMRHSTLVEAHVRAILIRFLHQSITSSNFISYHHITTVVVVVLIVIVVVTIIIVVVMITAWYGEQQAGDGRRGGDAVLPD